MVKKQNEKVISWLKSNPQDLKDIPDIDHSPSTHTEAPDSDTSQPKKKSKKSSKQKASKPSKSSKNGNTKNKTKSSNRDENEIAVIKQSKTRRKVFEKCRELNIMELANRYPNELSGGQQQLIAVALALAANPPLILADEPTANLDSSAARQIVARLRSLADSGRHGVLLATHDLRTASQADRVLTLRDGRILKETVLQPGRTTRDVLAELA